MLPRTSYPPGVPCWIDLVQPDPAATEAFYRELFGWAYEVRTPEGVPLRYAYARLDGQVVAGVGGPPACTDPSGAAFGLWQPAGTPGVELVNAPGSWNFTVLQAADPASVQAFYGVV